jgi:hypothetical protein
MIDAIPLSLFVILKMRIITNGKMKAVGRERRRAQLGEVVDVGMIAIGSGVTASSPGDVVLIPRSRRVAGAEEAGVGGVA